MRTIILTFDYELFFGESGTAEKCLIEPVNRLLEIFLQYNHKATFFVDTMYLHRLRTENYKTKQIYEKIEKQLKTLVKHGHRIELHLHPHWIDAVYNEKNDRWLFPTYSNYRFSALSNEYIQKIVSQGVNLLNSIGRQIIDNYAVMAFRAGGWNVEPFQLIKKALKDNNVFIDSSVAYGVLIKDRLNNIDFTKTPNKDYYRFSDTPSLEDCNGYFYEFPISTYRLGIIEKIKEKVNVKINQYPKMAVMGDGTYMPHSHKKNLRIRILKDYFFNLSMTYMFSIDGSFNLRRIIKQLKKKKTTTNIIAHPKSLTQYSFDFINEVSKLGYTLINIQTYYNSIQNQNLK